MTTVMKKSKEKAEKAFSSMLLEVMPAAAAMLVAVMFFFFFVAGISHDHPIFEMRDAKGKKVQPFGITPDDHLSLLYMVIPTSGVAMVNFLTQGLQLFVVETNAENRIKQMRMLIFLLSIVTATKNLSWSRTPPDPLYGEESFFPPLMHLVETSFSFVVMLYFVLILDPFKEYYTYKEDLFIMGGAILSSVLCFAAFVVSQGGNLTPSSFLSVALPRLINGSAKERHFVIALLIASGLSFTYSSVMLVQQARRTYMVARASMQSKDKNHRSHRTGIIQEEQEDVIDQVSYRASQQKLLSAVLLVLIYVGALVLHVYLSMNEVKTMWMLSLNGSNRALFESMVFGVVQYAFLHCILNLHCMMIDPLMVAYADAKRRNADRRAFLRYMLMEVRMPLNSIMMGLAILSGEELPTDEANDTLEMMNDASSFMAQTLADVYSIQKIELGEQEIPMGHCIVENIVRNTQTAMAGNLEAKSQRLEIQVAQEVPAVIWANENRLTHVLMNFTSNAIKFSAEYGLIAIHVSVLPGNFLAMKIPHDKLGGPRGNYVMLNFSVFDNGVGVQKDDQDMLFKPFTQIKPGELQGGRGSGVGLAICKQIVQKHHGQIGIISDPKIRAGSEFFFRIPTMPMKTDPEDSQGVPVEKLANVYGQEGFHLTEEILHQHEKHQAAMAEECERREEEEKEQHEKATDVTGAGPKDDSGSSSIHTEAQRTPVSAPAAGRMVPETAGLQEGTSHGNTNDSIRVLVVDDVTSNRKLLSILLRKHPRVICGESVSAFDALKLLQRGRQGCSTEPEYDIIFMDQVMPAINGLDATALLRGCKDTFVSEESNAAVRDLLGHGDIPTFPNLIIGLTGNALDEDLAAFRDAGADMAVSKPLKLELINGLIQHIVDHGSHSVLEERKQLLKTKNGGKAANASARLKSLLALSEL